MRGVVFWRWVVLAMLPWAAGAQDSGTVQIGPITLGMRAQEIREALPGAAWQVRQASPYTGRVWRMRAPDALAFGGQRVTVDVRDERYDWHVELAARLDGSDPRACEQAGAEFLAALEAATGPLTHESPPDGEVVEVGQRSRALWKANQNPGDVLSRRQAERGQVDRMSLTARRSGPRVEVRGQAVFDVRPAPHCRLLARVFSWRPRPPMEVMPYDETQVLRRMSVGERHRLALELTLPPEGVEIAVQCTVSRQSGEVLNCRSRDEAATPSAWQRVAWRHAGRLVFDTSGWDRDDPQAVLMELPVRLSPQDRRPLDFAGARTVSLEHIEFTQRPDADAVRKAYPFEARRQGVGADVDVTCQIQSDGSLVCRPPVALETERLGRFARSFEAAAERLVPGYVVAPSGRDGHPMAGAVIGLRVRFQAGPA